jgi:hypothetical protein
MPSVVAISRGVAQRSISSTILACWRDRPICRTIACQCSTVTGRAGSPSRESAASFERRRVNAAPQQKTGRRTKDAQRTPATGHTERALADAPFGARLKALLLYQQMSQFSLKQRLDAHASIQNVVDIAGDADGSIVFSPEDIRNHSISAAFPHIAQSPSTNRHGTAAFLVA